MSNVSVGYLIKTKSFWLKACLVPVWKNAKLSEWFHLERRAPEKPDTELLLGRSLSDQRPWENLLQVVNKWYLRGKQVSHFAIGVTGIAYKIIHYNLQTKHFFFSNCKRLEPLAKHQNSQRVKTDAVEQRLYTLLSVYYIVCYELYLSCIVVVIWIYSYPESL